jgi:hypothetical protein
MMNGKVFGKKSRDPIQALSRHLPKGTEENHKKPVSKKKTGAPAYIRTYDLPNTGPEHYRSVNMAFPC